MPVYYIIFSVLVITKLLTYIFDIQSIKYFCHVLSFYCYKSPTGQKHISFLLNANNGILQLYFILK